MIGLTPKMRAALLAIQELTDRNGFGPSYQEIADALGLSNKGAVNRLITRLCERGYLTHHPRRARSIEILGRLPMPEEPEFAGFFDPSAAQQSELAAAAVAYGMVA